MYDLLIKSGKNVRKGGCVTNVLNEYNGLDKAVKKGYNIKYASNREEIL